MHKTPYTLAEAMKDKALVDRVVASIVDEQFAKEREAAREARRRAWLEARLDDILNVAYQVSKLDSRAKAIELLREACEAWRNVE